MNSKAANRTFSLAEALKFDPAPSGTHMSLLELATSYLATHADGSDLRLRKWLEAFGERSAWSITAEELENAARILRDGGYQNATVNRDLSALGSIYRWAKQRRLAPPGFQSPTLGVTRFEEPIRRVYIAASDLERVRLAAMSFADRRFALFVALLIDTGARKSEILQRRWKEMNLESREILVPTSKTGNPRTLFFTDRTLRLLAKVCPRRSMDSLVFEGRVPHQAIDYKRAWGILREHLKMPHLRMHDIRHAAAANLLKAGVTLPVAAQVLGHDAAVLTRRYGHLETAALRSAQEAAWSVSCGTGQSSGHPLV